MIHHHPGGYLVPIQYELYSMLATQQQHPGTTCSCYFHLVQCMSIESLAQHQLSLGMMLLVKSNGLGIKQCELQMQGKLMKNSRKRTQGLTHSNTPSISSSILNARSCIAICCLPLPSVIICPHRFAFSSRYVARVSTTMRSTAHPHRIVQILGSSVMIIIGEKHQTKERMLALTEIGGVPFTSCSMINSQTK